jgi:hypothetical protein
MFFQLIYPLQQIGQGQNFQIQILTYFQVPKKKLKKKSIFCQKKRKGKKEKERKTLFEL